MRSKNFSQSERQEDKRKKRLEDVEKAKLLCKSMPFAVRSAVRVFLNLFRVAIGNAAVSQPTRYGLALARGLLAGEAAAR